MSPPTEHAQAAELTHTLRERFGAAAGPYAPPSPTLSEDVVIDEFVRSMLLWESTQALADAAWKRLVELVVDANELRVCSAREIAEFLGMEYPLVHDRAERLHAALADAIGSKTRLSQAVLAEQGKREARAYLEGIEGTPGFVAARVVLLHAGGHAAPVDGRILSRLNESTIVPRGRSCAEAATLVERQVRAGELAEFYGLVQAWADELPRPPAQPAPAGLGRVVAAESGGPGRTRPVRTGRSRPASEKP